MAFAPSIVPGPLPWTRQAAVTVLLAAAAVITLGTVWPVVVGWLGRQASVEPAWFARATAPLAALAAGLLVVWVVRRRGRTHVAARSVVRAATVGHLGFLVLTVGCIGTALGQEASATLRPREPTSLAGLTLTTDGARTETRGEVPAVVADVVVHDGGRVATLSPAIEGYPARGVRLPRPATWRRIDGDVQLSLGTASDDGRVVVVARTQPLIPLVWAGTVLLTVAGLLAGRACGRATGPPSRRRERAHRVRH